MPDPEAVRSGMTSSFRAARDAASAVSAQVAREVKGLTSSELEQVMLKATRPDDASVKGKHVERLVGVTYQISGKFDIYDAVLRKLWNKMTESDRRTRMKALYVLHRFATDGAPDHRASLKARLRELRRTKDPKSRTKERYFNTKRLAARSDAVANDDNADPAAVHYLNYLERYGRYVLLRAQCFGGPFCEISEGDGGSGSGSKKKRSRSSGNSGKPLTATRLRPDNLEGAAMVLEAGRACALEKGELCEHTAAAAERVAADLMGLAAATAAALGDALSGDGYEREDGALLKRWCVLYKEELLPRTKAMVKRVSPKLDRYGLFLPSRMGASLRTELLEKGLAYEENEEKKKKEDEEDDAAAEEEGNDDDDEVEDKKDDDDLAEEADAISGSRKVSAAADEEEEDDDDEDEDDEDEDEEDEDVPSSSKAKETAYEDDEDDDGYDYEEVEEYYDEE